MTHVLFTVPSFMGGGLPASGPVSKDITLVGTDDVTLIIKANTDTMYDENTRSFDAIPSKNRILYQFVFPVNTLVSADTTQYTTPKKSVYVFSDGSSTNKSGNKITKNVTTGTITIKPAPTDFFDQSVLKDSSISGDISMEDIANESPFSAIGLIVYKLGMDMIPIFIFWFLFVSISCWLVVKSSNLYPSDVSMYPFVFYKEGVSKFNPFKSEDPQLCSEINKGDISNLLDIQKEYFEKLSKNSQGLSKNPSSNNPEMDGLLEKEILKILHPSLMKMNEDGVNRFSSMLQDKCGKDDKCTLDYLLYFLGKIILNNYLYCNMVLAIVHGSASFFYEEALSKIPSPISVIVFAMVLYFLFLGVGAMNDQVKHMLGIHLQKDTDIKTMMLNQFYGVLISILSCCFCLILPLCSMLVITSLISTAYTVGSTVIFPFNATLGIVAFITLFFSLSQYVLIILRLAGGMSPLDLIENMYVKKLDLFTFGSLLGITLPILMGLMYGIYVGLNIFFTFFRFLEMPKVIELLKTTSASIVMVALFLLMMHVKEILGNTYVMMTFAIIVLIGYYVLTKTG
jgi:hypothetical protein